MALLDDVMTYLEGEGVATEGTDLFATAMLETHPDETTVVYETSGQPDEDTMSGDGSPAIRHASIQIRTRAGTWDYEAARTRCVDALNALVKIVNEDVNGTTYLRAKKANGPFPLGRDESDRWEIVANLDVSWLP